MKFNLSILGEQYTVEIDESAITETCEDLGIDVESTTGLHLSDYHKILVSPLQDSQEVVQTLLHEVLHAIGTVSGHTILAHSTRKNEAFVNMLATALTQLFNQENFMNFINNHLRKEE